jgi:hypothetical protein
MPLSRLPPWALLPIGLGPLVALSVFGSIIPRQAMMVAAGVAVLWAALAMTLHWKRLDEAAKAAHRWAWYWGSSLGLMLAMVFAASAYMWPSLLDFASPWALAMTRPGRSAEAVWLMLGVIGMGVAQAAGFIGAFVYWWTLKR